MKNLALDSLGKPGIVGLGILLFCLSFYVSSLAPLQDEIAGLRAEQARLARQGVATEAATPARPLPAFSTLPDRLKTMTDLAAGQGIAIDRASFRMSDQGGVRRVDMVVPLKAAYPALRAWLHALLQQPDAPALAEIKLQRPRADGTEVEADVHLSFLFAPS